MSTFQSVVLAIVYPVTSLLPISPEAHQEAIGYLLGWSSPPDALLASIYLGVFAGMLLFFRYDWLSMLSSFLQVILFRRAPKMMDERMPFYLILAAAPAGIGWVYLRQTVSEQIQTPFLLPLSLAATGLLLGWAESTNRSLKDMVSWTWLDSLLVGIVQWLWLIPGIGFAITAYSAALWRQYRREAAIKFSLYLITPMLGVEGFQRLSLVRFGSPTPTEGLSWLSFYVAGAVALLTALIALGGIAKSAERGSFKPHVVYRFGIAAALALGAWFYSRPV